MTEPPPLKRKCTLCRGIIKIDSRAYNGYYRKMCAYCQVETAKKIIKRDKRFADISATPCEEVDWLKSIIHEYEIKDIATNDIIQHLTGQLKELKFYDQIGGTNDSGQK